MAMNILRRMLIPFIPFARTGVRAASPSHSISSVLMNCVAEIEEDCSMSIADRLVQPVAEGPPPGGNKVTIIGNGRVAASCAFCILARKISNEVIFLGRNEKKLMAEMQDLQHGSVFMDNAVINSSTDYCAAADTRVCIVTAGSANAVGGDRMSLAKTNVGIMKELVPRFAETSPNSIIIVVTNPVDIATFAAWKSSGFPKSRVFGTGTLLDSARFRLLLSQRLNVSPKSCHGMIIGEHGASCVPVWSGVNIGGVRLRDLDPCIGISEDPMNFHKLGREVINCAYEVYKQKGYTNWAIALTCAAMTEAVLNNYNIIMPVSTSAKGLYCIDRDVCVSLPCLINSHGATAVVNQNLTEQENEQLQVSAEMVFKAQSGLMD